MRIDNLIISLDPFLIQESPNGRKFRVIGIEKNLSTKPLWINEAEKYCWIVTVKFLDSGQLVKLYFDHCDDCVKKVKLRSAVDVEDEISCKDQI